MSLALCCEGGGRRSDRIYTLRPLIAPAFASHCSRLARAAHRACAAIVLAPPSCCAARSCRRSCTCRRGAPPFQLHDLSAAPPFQQHRLFSSTTLLAAVDGAAVPSCHRAIMPPRIRAVVHRAAEAIAPSRHCAMVRASDHHVRPSSCRRAKLLAASWPGSLSPSSWPWVGLAPHPCMCHPVCSKLTLPCSTPTRGFLKVPVE